MHANSKQFILLKKCNQYIFFNYLFLLMKWCVVKKKLLWCFIGGGSSDSGSQQGTGDDSNYSDGNIYNHLYSLRFAGILLAVMIYCLCYALVNDNAALLYIKFKKKKKKKKFPLEIFSHIEIS
jgi:hypothetical protein